MAKKNTELEVNVAESKWDGRLLTFIGKSLLQLLVLAIFCGVGVYVACMNIVGKGGPWYEDIMVPANLIMVIVGAILIGLGICWASIIAIKYDVKHCVVSGQRMKFKAGMLNLFFNCIKWTFLTIITLGVYGLWMPVKVRKWALKHTVAYVEDCVVDEDEDEEYVEYPITYYTVDDDGNYEELDA